MPDRHVQSARILTVVLGLVLFAAVSTIAQAPASTAKPPATPARPAQAKPATAAPARVMPRTPWGAPDLQGTWFVIEDVPLERSAANANREFLTDEEVAAANKQKAEAQGRNTRAGNAAQDVEWRLQRRVQLGAEDRQADLESHRSALRLDSSDRGGCGGRRGGWLRAGSRSRRQRRERRGQGGAARRARRPARLRSASGSAGRSAAGARSEPARRRRRLRRRPGQ